MRKKNELIVEEEEEHKTKTQIIKDKKKEKEKLIQEKKKRQEIKDLEKSIEERETEIADLDQQLCDPQLYDNPKRIAELSKEREYLQKKLDELYEKWIELTEL